MHWLQQNLVWIIPALWGAVEAYRGRKGSLAEKAFAAGEAAYEAEKEAHFHEVTKKLGDAAGDLELMVPEWKRKLDEADAKLRALRPKRGQGLRPKLPEAKAVKQ